MSIPRFKRKAINWDYIYNAIISQGYTLKSISDIIGCSYSLLEKSKLDSKMNPAVLDSICKLVDLDRNKALLVDEYERIRNGRSTGGRLKVDWIKIESRAYKKGYSLHKLSVKMGKGSGYLYSCKCEGGVSKDILEQLASILKIKPNKLLEKSVLDKTVINMVQNISFTENESDSEE